MSAPGGRSIAEAITRADSGLEHHRAEAMKALTQRVAALEALSAGRAAGSEAEVYEQAAALIDMAGFFETGPLYKACFSLCELSDRLIGAGAWSWPSVAVHVQALRLILTNDCQETEEIDMVLEGLSTIVGRFSIQPH
jgi:hypothetical protein